MEKFVYSIGILTALRDRSWSRAAWLEYIILSQAHIDSLLRWGIALVEGMETQSISINEDWLTERKKEDEIIKRASKMNIINSDLAEDLELLRNKRNAIVHGFAITDIEFELSKRTAAEYEPRIIKIYESVSKLEIKAISEGKPINDELVANFQNDKKFRKFLKSKLGIPIEELNKVRKHKWPDVEDIVNHAARKGWLKKCTTCSHPKIYHYRFPKKITQNLEDYNSSCKFDTACKCQRYK